MPTGAMNVALCFSAASIKMVKTSSAVKNISMKSPCVTVVPPPKAVRTFKGPGNNADTTAAAEIEPSNWDIIRSPPRTHGTAPTRHMPNVTAGLKRPVADTEISIHHHCTIASMKEARQRSPLSYRHLSERKPMH